MVWSGPDIHTCSHWGETEVRKCSFWSAAGAAAGGLVVMAIMGRDGADSVRTADVMRAAILGAVILATWLVVDRQERIIRRLEEMERARAERDVLDCDRELLVAETIAATLKATGHEMTRPAAKVYQMQP